MDARQFLGMEPTEDGSLHWRLPVTREVSTPGAFLYGGCGLGAALVALEEASGRPTVWAAAQYLSFAPTGGVVDLEVVLAAVGRHVTQGRVVGTLEGREILTVNAALGTGRYPVEGTWIDPPEVPEPLECPESEPLAIFADSILTRVEHRVALGSVMGSDGPPSPPGGPGSPGDGASAFWARVPEHLGPSAATLAILGDYVSGGVSQPTGVRTMGRSLDNTLRIARLVPTEWILCDIRIHGVARGFAHGRAHLWSENRVLLGTASQSLSVRPWPDAAPPGLTAERP
ncbi:MAG: thioesterase family protein [Actinomycetota bacterium]|nr:thioesterase family protein [Actinomycetota bacterium]